MTIGPPAWPYILMPSQNALCIRFHVITLIYINRDFRLLAVMDLVAHVRDANHAISYSTESIRFGGSLMRAYVIADSGLRLQLREKIEVS